MMKKHILWVDDEIDMLKAHILFLEGRGYTVHAVTNGEDAIEYARKEPFDLVLLDEMMPGKDGLQTLVEIKRINPALPVIMITKNEEESLMDDAIGRKIDDYLLKPINPTQILSACKRILDVKSITAAQISKDYVTDFREISTLLAMGPRFDEWTEIFTKLTNWDLELDQHFNVGLEETLRDQKKDVNIEFSKYIEKNYIDWLHSDTRPVLSPDILGHHVIPLLQDGKRVFFFVIDCLRLDQWLSIEPFLYDFYHVTKDYYCSILPTATPYARNSIFSGLFPAEIEKEHPEIWEGKGEDEYSRNRNERQLLDTHLQRAGLDMVDDTRYVKILDVDEARYTERKLESYQKFKLVSIVLNFVDILAHKRSESEVLKEIAPNEPAYRSLTKSWFEHSAIYAILRKLADTECEVIITTDHGSIRSMRATKVVGDKDTSTSLRYKFGRNLKADPKHTLLIKNPNDFMLPKRGINTEYLLAKEDYYLIYPTNFNQYAQMYKDSFQHGGISLEEMILPIVRLSPK